MVSKQFIPRGHQMSKINIGEQLPDFELTDSDGNYFTNEELLGSFSIIYFYPKDETPGCTKEACEFRDNIEQFDFLDAVVIGVSPDNEESHQKFQETHELPFPLLCDPEKQLCEKMGVVKDGNIVRTTFIADPLGIIRWIEQPVNVTGHVERALQALQEIQEKEAAE